MANPYRLDPRSLKAITQQVQEQKLVTLRDDGTRPPPTLGTPIWQGAIFGPWLGQPASRLQTFEHGPKPLHGALSILIGLGSIVGVLILLRMIFH
jgi:hypothetical protein